MNWICLTPLITLCTNPQTKTRLGRFVMFYSNTLIVVVDCRDLAHSHESSKSESEPSDKPASSQRNAIDPNPNCAERKFNFDPAHPFFFLAPGRNKTSVSAVNPIKSHSALSEYIRTDGVGLVHGIGRSRMSPARDRKPPLSRSQCFWNSNDYLFHETEAFMLVRINLDITFCGSTALHGK